MFKDEENLFRKEEYIKDGQTEDFLDRLNARLHGMEQEEYREIEKPFPLIFVIGVPRSGTTLMTQLLAGSLDIGYINNLIARFWLTPVYGIRLSKILLNNNTEGLPFSSNYGKTNSIYGPHEFSYFWLRWLEMENTPPYLPDEAHEKINWQALKLTLRNMAAEFGRPLMLKAANIGYHIKKFKELFPEAIFVLTKRDLADIAVSLHNGRTAYYGNTETWFSMYPTEYEDIKNLDSREQVARQVCSLDKMFTDGLSTIEEDRKIIVELEALCSAPNDTLDTLRKQILNLSGISIKPSCELAESLEFSTYKGSKDYDYFKELISRIKKS